MKNIFKKLALVWHIIKSKNDIVLTDSIFHTSLGNLDITEPNYECIENSDGGYDICYIVPWNNGKKCFTVTVARFKGRNAGQFVDLTLDILNEHSIIDEGDAAEQPIPSRTYIPYK